MDCDEAQLVMAVYIANDPSLTQEERQGFEAHVHACPDCAQDYRESRYVLSLVKAFGTISDDTRRLLESQGVEVKSRKSFSTIIEDGWEALKRRFPELTHLERRQKRRKRLYRIGKITAVAAALLLAFSLGWKLLAWPHSPAPKAAPIPVPVQATVERVDGLQHSPLALGQRLTTQAHKQELRLGAMHRLVVNTGTTLTVQADELDGKTRYNLALAEGELYAEVVPGHPFTVTTPNARLTITGTKFNVRYDRDQTALTLVKGSVRFGNRRGQSVDVSAGHASTIARQAAPTPPAKADTEAAVAWLREPAPHQPSAKRPTAAGEMPLGIEDLALQWQPSFPALESLDYGPWTQSKREFFAQDFPWIMPLEKALRDRGLDTDYVTLLMVSGDLWQFRYPLKLDQPMGTINPAGLRRVADLYRLDREALGAILPQAKTASPLNPKQYQEALRHWQTAIQGATHQPEMPAELAAFSFRAVIYLNTTYTAAWLWIKTHPALAERLLADRPYAAIRPATIWSGTIPTPQTWLADIQRQVSILQAAGATAYKLFAATSATTCSSPSRELPQRLLDELSLLMPSEHRRELPTEGNSR